MDAPEEAREGDHEQKQRDPRDGRKPLREAGAEDHHLADEQSERRQPDEGQHRRQERRAGPRHAAHQPADGRDLGRPVRGADAARDQKASRLGQGMVGDVQERTGGAQGSAEAEPEADETDVLDTRVREHALVVGRGPQECRGHGDGQHAERKQDAAREAGPGRRVHGGLESQDRVNADAQQHARHEGAHRRRRLAVGVGQPRVHRRQPGLRAIADHEEHERELDDSRRQPGRQPQERRPPKGVDLVAELLDAGEIHQDSPEERDGDAHRADQQILVGRLERGARALEVDEEDRRERGALDRDPHEPDVVGRDGEQHREHEQVEERIEAARRRVRDVTGRFRRGQRADDADEGDHPRRQGVGAKQPVERRQRLAAVHRHGHGEGAHQGQRRRHGVERRREPADRAPRERGPDERDRQDEHQHHPRSSRSRSTSIESCSRRTWTTTASMMRTITSTSRKTPASTMPGRP